MNHCFATEERKGLATSPTREHCQEVRTSIHCLSLIKAEVERRSRLEGSLEVWAIFDRLEQFYALFGFTFTKNLFLKQSQL